MLPPKARSMLLKKEEDLILKKSLQSFQQSSLSHFSLEKIKQAQKIFQKIQKKKSSPLFLFVFGGMGGSSFLFDFKSSKKKPYRIDKVKSQFIEEFLKKTKSELKNSHFLFLSKSAKTPELFFYQKLLQSLYTKKQLSLKNKITVLSSSSKSPFLQFAKKEQAEIILLEEDLPGRFSVFTLSGFLQLYLQGFDPLKMRPSVFQTQCFLESFLLKQRAKKEYWLCCSNELLQKFGIWFELLWSESLLKNVKNKVPSLRFVSLYKVQHAFIEELIAKKKEIGVVFLDFKRASLSQTQSDKTSSFKTASLGFANTKSPYLEYLLNFQHKSKKRFFEIIDAQKIPMLNLEVDSTEQALCDLMFSFYRSLFLLGDCFKVNIFQNDQVDDLKRRLV